MTSISPHLFEFRWLVQRFAALEITHFRYCGLGLMFTRFTLLSYEINHLRASWLQHWSKKSCFYGGDTSHPKLASIDSSCFYLLMTFTCWFRIFSCLSDAFLSQLTFPFRIAAMWVYFQWLFKIFFLYFLFAVSRSIYKWVDFMDYTTLQLDHNLNTLWIIIYLLTCHWWS